MADFSQRKRSHKAFRSLRAYFEETGRFQNDVANAADITEAHLSNIMAGRVCPSLGIAVKLSELTSVPVEALWYHYALHSEKNAGSPQKPQ